MGCGSLLFTFTSDVPILVDDKNDANVYVGMLNAGRR